jgi:23S rRNA (guanine745-N1)-methyltransferase
MLSKRERLFSAIEQLNGLICPTCRKPLDRQGDSLICESGHLLNVNRRGCLNLLSARVDTFYDAALFASRQRVFDAGCYRSVADLLRTMLPDHPARILDAGCGEGWYLNDLLTTRPDCIGAGIDISRDAILLAANHPCSAVWCVADLRRVPFADGTFDIVLDVLTPANYQEFQRVLKPEGTFIKVYPGEDYLREIRAVRGLPAYADGQVDAYLHEKATVLKTCHVHEAVTVTPSLWRDFVYMTPLNQDLSDAEKEQLASMPRECITIDLHIAQCRLQ